MKIEQITWTDGGWDGEETSDLADANLVIWFAAPGTMSDGGRFAEMRARYPSADIVGCTTGGEIVADEVLDQSVVATAIRFDATRTKVAVTEVDSAKDSTSAGRKLAEELNADDINNVFVLSDGINVNGSELVRGFRSVIGDQLPLTGGLAGDGADFGTTYVGCNDAPSPKRIVAVGFYGDALTIGHGSVGGWDTFGPQRTITRSEGNVLFELDGQPALELYKKYLGEEAEKLPGSALLFPLRVTPKDGSGGDIVRTILTIDENDQSMTFAGDVPQGHVAQLMRGNFDHLVTGASQAAESAAKQDGSGEGQARLAVLVSCIGRKLLMGQRVSDEVEAVADVLGDNTKVLGYYSYGEISPHEATGVCELHNQTMTVTTFVEA